MSKIKVSTLTGPLLDKWAGKANNLNVEIDDDGKCFVVVIGGIGLLAEYSPSTHWSQGGPIIERELICHRWDSSYQKWYAFTPDNLIQLISGDTLLIAGMRCFVAGKFGEEVDE